MIKIINQELYDKYTEFLNASLVLLNNFLNTDERIPYAVYDYFKPEVSGWSGISIKEKKYSIFIEQHEDDIVNLPDFIKLVEIMVHNPMLRDRLNGILIDENDPVTLSNIDTIFIYNWILPIIGSFVERSKSFVFNDRLCDELYKEYEDFFYNADRYLNAIAPLHNFESELEVILLDENLKIRKICEGEQKQLWREKFSIIPQSEIPSIKFVLETRYKVKDHEAGEMFHINESFDMVISAMRLFKKGTFGYNLVTTKIYWACPISKASTSSSKIYYEHYHGNKYNLSKDEAESLVKFWEVYKKVNFKKYSFIGLAIKRFNLTHVRKDFEDKLIDMMIAFEALYLIHTDKELSYKLAIRAAFILGKDKSKSEKENIYIFLKKAYNIRSGIVHGNKHLDQNKIKLSDKGDISVRDFVLQSEDYLRQSIVHFIDLSLKHDAEEIAKYLDRIMFS